MVTLADILKFQFPASPRGAYIVSDEGAGQLIAYWNAVAMGRSIPSTAEIDGWRPAAQTSADAAAADEASHQTNLNDLIAQASGAVSSNNDYLAIPTPTNAQVVAQVRALTQQNNRIIRAVVWILRRLR